MDLKKTSTAYARMAKSGFSNFFEHNPNLSLVKTPQTTTQASNNVWKL